jgi:hypothetical protein
MILGSFKSNEKIVLKKLIMLMLDHQRQYRELMVAEYLPAPGSALTRSWTAWDLKAHKGQFQDAG